MTPRPSPRRPRRSSHSGRSSGAPKKPRTAARPLEPSEEPPDISSFREWDLGDDVQHAIAEMGIEKPTPIQALAIGEVLQRRDVIAKAETGTGKTLAFGAPMMARIDPTRRSVLGLVLSPTRELSEQVFTVLADLGKARGVKVALVVGGEPLAPQVQAIQGGAQVIVATPGRILDLMGQGFLTFPWTEFCVLDEADKMLEIGFIDDVKKILEATDPDVRQTLLFSATFPPALLDLARNYTREPAEIATASGVATVDTIRQFYLHVDEESAPRALATIIRRSQKDDVFLVFCDRRTDVDKLFRRMERERFPVKALHGGYDQAARFRVMSAFRTGEVKALIATDVASRGLDVNHVTHVINLGVPRDISDYTHRIGRTGRAGRTGVSVTLVTPRAQRSWRGLMAQAPWSVEELSTPFDLADREAAGKDEEQPKRGARDRDRGGRSRDRGRGRDDERPRRSRDRREEHGSQPDRDRGEEQDERPSRRRREQSDEQPAREHRGERDERPSRRRRAERDERPSRSRGEERDERPSRSRGEERDERPSRSRGEERDERPARDQREQQDEPRPRRKREERGPKEGGGEPAGRRKRTRSRPEREQEDRPRRGGRGEQESEAASDGGFGSGVEGSSPERGRSRGKKRDAGRPEERERNDEPTERQSGFGSGI